MVLSALIVMAVAAACYPFAAWIGYHAVALILLLVVSVLAMRQELPAVLTAAVLSALLWDFFFIPPHFTLSVQSGEDVLLIVMYFIVAMLNGVIQYRVRQMAHLQRVTEERERSLLLYNTLFNSLSHDLRTPVAAVMVAADTLQENRAQLTEAQHTALIEEVLNGTLRISEQVENLLNMSRIEAGILQPRREWCDLSELIHEVLHKMPVVEGQKPVEVVIPKDFPLVQLDFGLTFQILQNILLNTRRHTPPDTQIVIVAALQHESDGHFEETDEAGQVRLSTDAVRHRLFLEIYDNGPGIAPKALPYIFDKFYRSSETHSTGTGLGLFVVRGFTEAQGGEVRAHNRLQGGVCFTLEFPTLIVSPSLIQHA